MPIVQGGPPAWTWERTPDPLKWDLRSRGGGEGGSAFILRAQCGLEILELQALSTQELQALAALLTQQLTGREDRDDDCIDEASLESFPASDPPSFTPVTGPTPQAASRTR